MKLEDMIMVSVDDHIIEPPKLFENHTPASLKGKMPYVVSKNGIEFWCFEDRLMPNLALNAVVGRRPEEFGFEPTSLSHCRPGCYDVKERVRDMNANGQLAGLNFPSWGRSYVQSKDKTLALAVMQAHNDWNLDEWCGYAPERFISCCHVPVWDPQLAAQEIKRLKSKGCHSITLPPNPVPDGLPSWHQDYWDPIFKACLDNDIMINMHIGDPTNAVPSPDSAVDTFIVMMGTTLYSTAVDLVFSPVFRKFKDLKISLSEGGAGWVPNAMDRMDFIYKRHRVWTNQDCGGDRLPSDVMRDHFLFCIVYEPAAIAMRDVIGIDTIAWENDYPHAESTWPKSPEMFWPSIEHLSDTEINKITHENAMRMFNFDPFKIRPRDKCNVAALRAEATDVDLGYLPTGQGIPPKRGGEGYVSLRDVMGQVGEAYNMNIPKGDAEATH